MKHYGILFFVSILLFLFSGTVFFRYVRGVGEVICTPALNASASLRTRIQKISLFFDGQRRLAQRVAFLESQVGRCEVDAIHLARLEKENEELRTRYTLLENQDNRVVPAHVFGGDPLLLNIGEDSGVVPGVPVLAHGVLFGVVSETFTRTSVIDRVSVLTQKIPVQLYGGTTRGILVREGTSLFVTYVQSSQAIEKGAVWVTVGDEAMDPYIPVVVSSQPVSESSQPTQKIRVEPLAPMQGVDTVFVMRK